MIKPKVVHKISNQEGVRPQQIEKDYIISWLLWGISNHDFLKDALTFKGGTCLKKIHIEDYRYSEDMDFTMNPDIEDDISNDEIYSAFDKVFVEIRAAANINLSIPEGSKDLHESTNSMKFYIDYIGPLGGSGDHVKLDITRGEQLEFDVEQGVVRHDYSDLKEEGDYNIQCYGLKEVVIEKMAAMMGRTVPKDLYDFDYLTNIEGIELQDVHYEFKRKAEHKGQNPAEFIEKVTGKQKTYENAWKDNLSHQIKELPKFKDVWRRIGKQLRKFEKIK
ncbi:MAG: nucleotidyl transferase AbiEii/AbiGii toxin family protein [Candidatus Marinimicrobia bacterium]|nr:nucleotidyl transferase AbiEii/AbiGii toxin family protein [Candidatus Neomarinimicrobiota bacterium]